MTRRSHLLTANRPLAVTPVQLARLLRIDRHQVHNVLLKPHPDNPLGRPLRHVRLGPRTIRILYEDVLALFQAQGREVPDLGNGHDA